MESMIHMSNMANTTPTQHLTSPIDESIKAERSQNPDGRVRRMNGSPRYASYDIPFWERI